MTVERGLFRLQNSFADGFRTWPGVLFLRVHNEYHLDIERLSGEPLRTDPVAFVLLRHEIRLAAF